jgi:ribosomal protein L3 glutamine methyltransferase
VSATSYWPCSSVASNERIPAAYLTGEAWFAGLSFKSDPRALVPRSPIAELIESHFEPWLGGREVQRALDICTGSGCIAIAMAHHHPDWQVDGVDISDAALALAEENKKRLHADNVRLLKSDLFSAVKGERYDLIVTNPPYVTNDETDALPPEYAHEPELGLRAGHDGLDLALRILRDAPDHLADDGLLICEVGEAERALVELLPEIPFSWIEFKVGQMGIFAVDRADLIVQHHARPDQARWRTRVMMSDNILLRAPAARHHLRRKPRPGHRLRDRRLPAGHRDRAGGVPRDLARRATGKSRHTSQRHEADEIEILSGCLRRPSPPARRSRCLIRNTDASAARTTQHRRAVPSGRTPTTPTGRSTASAIRVAAGVRARARPRCASPPR